MPSKRLFWTSICLKKYAGGLVYLTLHKKVKIIKIIIDTIYYYQYTAYLGTYRWSASHSVASYTNWARASQYEPGDTDEPNGGTEENCVYKSLSYPPGWSDLSCAATEADTMPCFALCQYGHPPQPSPAPTPTTPPTTSPGMCKLKHLELEFVID